MPDILLSRVEPENNCYRFYRISIEPNLFGDHSIMIQWGRIGHLGRVRIASSGERGAINHRAGLIERRKIKKGYVRQDAKENLTLWGDDIIEVDIQP
ncbi:WGR domain-containing protein [Loktanella sp. DJP18]|uniref:WGR domain-containing protein n=1 Tax=Loktanella sp. DJP18 TaxID=3409788 RepID=UPI003BB48938